MLTGLQTLLIGLCNESHTAFVLNAYAFPSLTEYYAFVILRGRHFAASQHSRLDEFTYYPASNNKPHSTSIAPRKRDVSQGLPQIRSTAIFASLPFIGSRNDSGGLR